MKIDENQIKEKRIAGTCKHGPVVYILTKGGLHAFFSKNEGGNITSLAAAPHKAIGSFFAEQKEPSIRWHDDFLGKSESIEHDLIKNETAQFEKYRSIIWSQGVSLSKSEASDIYLVYDVATNDIWVDDRSEIANDIINKSINMNSVVRPIDLTKPPRVLSMCDEFKAVVDDKP